MNITWISACLPALLALPSEVDWLMGGTTSWWKRMQPTVQQQVQREQRGVGVLIDHDARTIVIRSWFFAAHQDPMAQRQLEAIQAYWHSQNERFVYQLPTDQGKLQYEIIFELKEAPGTYGEEGFFLPAPEVPLDLLNQIEVVPDQAINRVLPQRVGRRVVGYAPNNFIYIADGQSDQTWIGVHEAGHRLGAGHHHTGIMQPDLVDEHLHHKLPRKVVRELLATADIIGRGAHGRHMAQHPVRAAQTDHQGQIPQGFFTKGKVKRI